MKKGCTRDFQTAYHPPGRDALIWGVRVLDAGFEAFPPGKPYPSKEHHPAPYLYDWEKGRVFSEYQLLAITRGSGILETATCPHLALQAGDLFILFPGEWHRFRPDPAPAGMKTSWASRRHARHLMHASSRRTSRSCAARQPAKRVADPQIVHQVGDHLPRNRTAGFRDMITLITPPRAF